jgi:hypothetical protein
VTDLYILLFTTLISPPEGKEAPGHGREGYYFAENGEHTLSDIYNTLAKLLFEAGKAGSPEPTLLNEEELGVSPLVCQPFLLANCSRSL